MLHSSGQVNAEKAGEAIEEFLRAVVYDRLFEFYQRVGWKEFERLAVHAVEGTSGGRLNVECAKAILAGVSRREFILAYCAVGAA